MMPEDSSSLLDQFLTDRSERAFRRLVQRYLPLVHAVAFRSLRDAELAKEVSQQVFIRLAEKAGCIHQECGLVAWLHRTAHSLAVDAVRREQRRKLREQKAAAMSALSSSAFSEVAWESLAPVLDDLLNRLPENDRRVILLRYYENRPLASVAASLGIQEKAAAKRSIRALEKLRELFAKQGIATSSSALAALLPLHAAPILPASAAAMVSASAFPFAVTASSGFLSSLISLSPVMKIWSGAAALLLLGLTLYMKFSPAVGGGSTIAPPPAVAGTTTGSSERAVRASRGEPSSVSQLDDIAKISNLFERLRALDGLLGGLPKADFPEASTKLTALGFESDSKEMRLLISHWCELDPAAAYRFSIEKQESWSLTTMVVEEWRERDFDAAYATVMRESPREMLDITLRTLLTSSTASPDRILSAMGDVLLSMSRRTSIAVAVDFLNNHPGSLSELGANVPEPVDRDGLLGFFVAAVSFRGEQLQAGFSHTKVSPEKLAGSRDPSRIALGDQVFAANWIAGNSEAALHCEELDAGNLFHALALADHDQAQQIASKIPESSGPLRQEVERAIELANPSSSGISKISGSLPKP